MRYMGGKSRQAPHLTDIIKTYTHTAYFEPFLGGGSVFELVAGFARNPLASDIHLDLMLMWQALLNGWKPPTEVTREEYEELKSAPPSELRGFVGFGCSFGGKWFGGYASERQDTKHTGDICGASRRIVLRQADAMRKAGAKLRCHSYEDLDPGRGSLVYCDPPYKGTTGYSGTEPFDHSTFWARAREWAAQGALVLVSEYTAPKDIPCVWERPARKSLKYKVNTDMAVERLYAIGGMPPIPTQRQPHSRRIQPMSAYSEVDQFFAGGGAPPSERVNGRYKMVGPDGDQHSYQTASNYAFPLIDQFGLNRWRLRQLLTGVAMRPDLQALLATMDTADPDRGKLDEVIETAMQVAGTTVDANRGTAVHSALQAADEGKAYPPEYSSYVDYYREGLAHFGLRVVLTERLVVYPELGAAGRPDRLYQEADGTLVIGDVKTTGRLDMAEHEISVQLAVYQGASHVRDEDGKGWISLRDGARVRDDYAVVVHVDKDTGAVAMYRCDLLIGRHGANLAEQVRGWRKSGPVLLPYVPPMGAGPNTVDPATVAVQAEHPEISGAGVPTMYPNGGPDPFERNTQAHNEAADIFGGPTVTGPPADSVPGKTAAELMKPNVTKAEVQQYCRAHGITDLAHTKKVLVEMLAKAGKLAASGSQPVAPSTASVPPAENPRSDIFRQLQLGRIKAATSVGDLQSLNRAIVTKHGDAAWTDELTEAARLRVAELDAPGQGPTPLDRVVAAERPEDLAKLWEEVTIGNSAPGAWTPALDQAARARLTELNNARPPAPANPFAGS